VTTQDLCGWNPGFVNHVRGNTCLTI